MDKEKAMRKKRSEHESIKSVNESIRHLLDAALPLLEKKDLLDMQKLHAGIFEKTKSWKIKKCAVFYLIPLHAILSLYLDEMEKS